MRKKALATALTAVGVALILVSTMILFQIETNRANYMYPRIVGPSMEPTLSNGDVLRVEPMLNTCEIHAAPKDADPPGDIIIFHEPRGELIAHRAIAKIVSTDGSCSFRTQGDNNPSQDGWVVRESDIVGKVVEVNPPLWAYNHVFWAIILAFGIGFMLVGVILIIL